MRYKLTLLFFFISLLTPVALWGQEAILKGKITATDSGEPLPYAHLTLCGTTEGTITNKEGRFRLVISQWNKADTLCLTYMGYQPVRLPLASIDISQPLNLEMEPATTQLAAITVTAAKLPANTIVRRMLSRLGQNHRQRPFLLETYYRDYLRYYDTTKHLLEAAVAIFDPGFKKDPEDIRVKIYQSRHQFGNPLNYRNRYENNVIGLQQNVSFFGGNHLSVLLFNDPVRNHKRNDMSMVHSGLDLNSDFASQHSFTHEYITTFNNRKVYVIAFEALPVHEYYKMLEPAENPDSHSLSGLLFIDARDFGLLRIEANLNKPRGQFITNVQRLKADYRRFKGRYYLHYLSFRNTLPMDAGEGKRDYYHYRELFVNRLITDRIPQPRQTFTLFHRANLIYNQQYMKDPDFWNRYNLILTEAPELD